MPDVTTSRKDAMATNSSPMRSLERAIDVLEVLDSARGPLRLTEIARRADLPVATTQRILAALESRDRVEHDTYGYRPGIGLTFGAHAYTVSNPLIRAARPVLIELASLTGMTATLFREHRDQRVVLSRAGIVRHFGYELNVGSRLPLYVGAGKTLLARKDDAEVRSLLEALRSEPGPQVTPLPETDALLEDLAGIRERGYSIAREEREPGVASVAVAVPSSAGVAATVQVSGPLEEFPQDDRAVVLARQVQQAAYRIGHELPGQDI